MIAGIDAGGTTFKCAIADESGNIVARKRIATTEPEETIAGCTAFLLEELNKAKTNLNRLGIGAFGPLNIDQTLPEYGTILTTPKPHWSNTNLRQAFETVLKCPVMIDTDVNAALRAEMTSGAAKCALSAAYITVGTGIGAGLFVNGGFAGTPNHPEFGHIYVKRHEADLQFAGICPFHGDCLEGLASAKAFEARHGDATRLPPNHLGWDIEAFYLAQAAHALVASTRLDRIILGGGLMEAAGLIDKIRMQFLKLNANYLPFTENEVSDLIVLPGHGADAGLQGALSLAHER